MKELHIEEKVPLSGLSTFKVGGEAHFVLHIESEGQIKGALQFAEEKNLPVLVLGGGSNMLFSDNDFSGVVLKLEIMGKEVMEEDEKVLVKAGAGEEWDAFVAWTVGHGYFGLENLSGIPGTVGAAPIQNIGAYGVEAKDYIESVVVFDMKEGKVKTLSNIECGFGYRTSVFKKESGKNFIVTSVTFSLSKVPDVKISYKDLSRFFEGREDISSIDVRNAVIEIRRSKFPDLKTSGTAGSFWKNIITDSANAERLLLEYPDMPVYDAPEGKKKISTAYILDKVCGLKDFREGNVGLFTKQSLVVTNYGGASSSEIRNFIAKVKSIVEEKTGIFLEEEVVIL
ncbi:MAG: UDP-N-acetylmuramate dehydrogenase [Candidatus Paceibacterota bacterium]|jgi:UDP-N-acetylmuramate dehydrogenase